MATALLAGWGRTAFTGTRLTEPTRESAPETVRMAERMIARGLGRGYGDCAVIGGGTTVSTTNLRSLRIDGDCIEVDAGTSLEEVIKFALPQGWFVPVTPGTRFVTVGGAIAADIHGKNHHRDGTFGSHVERIDLLLASGEVRSLTPSDRLFWATVGGMGLTGIILSARVRMTPVETSQMRTVNQRVKNVDTLMELMVRADHEWRYSVAWVDTMATKGALGRSVLSTGEHATRAELESKKEPLAYEPRQRLTAPSFVPSGVLNKWSVRAFNEAWFRKAPRKAKRGIESITHFFHPLDGVGEWNRIYGPLGFIQYQVVVPDAQAATVPWIIETFATRQVPVFLAVLKRFGNANEGMLSFPTTGWTLALDIPAGVSGVAEILDEMDE
ncbi:MAG: FAD-dependent oxidoreductase, partial [Actinomycetota bacterium]